MKIWVIGRNYPTPSNKMCGSFEFEQAQMISRKGHDVTYIACPFHPLYKVKKWGFVSWAEGDIKVYAYSQLYFPQRMKIYLDSFKKKTWDKLLRKVESEQGIPDIIHLHYPTMISIPQSILDYKTKGTRIVTTEHWTNVQTGKISHHAKMQLQKYVEEADHFICVGKPLKQSVEKLTCTQRTIDVVPNIVPQSFVAEKQDHKGFVFVAIGRLVKVKQVDKIVSSFAKAFSEEKDVRLIIAGGGSEYKKIKKQILELGLNDRVKLTGALPRTKIAELMQRSDALVSYSNLETFGVPVIEAWYCGLPSIATTAIGFSEYWKSELGILIPYDDEKTLIHALKKMKEDYSQYSADYIKEYARSHFSEEAVYEKLITLYNN